MKLKQLLLPILLSFTCMCIQAKTTYIPTYRSYIHIVNGDDTASVTNNLADLELAESSGLFNIRIEHEDVTQEKVKAIKRAKRTAGWMTFSAVMAGMSTAFSNNNLQYFVRSSNYKLTSDLAGIYSANANAEQVLDIYMWIDNKTSDEMMVNDMERGLVWYILPHESLRLKINNPEASRLRISTPKCDFVRYASVIVGSKVTKWELAYEDDDCWVVAIYSTVDGTVNSGWIEKYKCIWKADYKEEDIDFDEYKVFKKERKNAKQKP